MTPEERRTTHRRALRNWSQIATKAERAYRAAIARRDEAIVAAHGPKAEGGMSYSEIMEATGLARSRVIQIVHGARGETA